MSALDEVEEPETLHRKVRVSVTYRAAQTIDIDVPLDGNGRLHWTPSRLGQYVQEGLPVAAEVTGFHYADEGSDG